MNLEKLANRESETAKSHKRNTSLQETDVGVELENRKIGNRLSS